jgi:hypothetical protein
VLSSTNNTQRFYADPVNVPDIEAFVSGVLASSQGQLANPSKLTSVREPRGIERLPNELLDTICNYLPTESVIKLHRTSKIMARKLRLDNAFWRDHLRNGRLHPHIWNLDTKGIEVLRQESNMRLSVVEWDWKTVAKLLATKRFPITGCDPRLDNIPLGLWNRCRIWSTIERAFEHDYLRKRIRGRSDSCLNFRTKVEL